MSVPSLQHLSRDLLRSIARHLDLADIYALQLMRDYRFRIIDIRLIYRELAAGLLRRCRPLPLFGFRRLAALSVECELVQVVNRATQLERGWLTRTPRPAVNAFVSEGEKPETLDGTIQPIDSGIKSKSWYKVVGTPPDEEVDWLSPLTADCLLFATKSGKVFCWDVHRDVGIAEWNHGERWELWKCRVEFERRIAYFTMAKVLRGSIGLYVLLDWNKEEYVFVDTAIQCTNTANWSCILCDGSIVIHRGDLRVSAFFPTICAFATRHGLQYITLICTTDDHEAEACAIDISRVQDPTPPTDVNNPPNPWSDQLWYPESAHFIRQWWPTLPSIPRLSCTVVLLAQHHPHTHVTKYVLAKHCFSVPLSASNAETDASDATMRMWYRALLAVDFGHAVWLEHVRAADDDEEEEPCERGQKRLRFASFPDVRLLEGEGHAARSGIGGGGGPDGTFEVEGTVRTLAIPEELDGPSRGGDDRHGPEPGRGDIVVHATYQPVARGPATGMTTIFAYEFHDLYALPWGACKSS
ncbi:hypothetical protein F5148DRAFT_1304213 [Russula earlei]|uniref:Uncharacterized protein n=1 Tax=Russula earlei TaxID=71964 RepID=A0ACC0UAA6_9AGAM|nr:hypothetical protein F5148DRAFT_1304213 [Russula earlei]